MRKAFLFTFLALIPVGSPAADAAAQPAFDAIPQAEPLTPNIELPSDLAETLPLKPLRERLTVAVRIGESRPFDFILDTGSESTIVSSDVAEEVGLVPNERISIISVGGRGEADLVRVETMTIGSRSVHDFVAPLLHDYHVGADGIVGINALQDQLVTIDFANNVILVEPAVRPLRESEHDIVVTARRRRDRLIIRRAVIDNTEVDIVIDTGAGLSVGNNALREKLTRRGTAIAEAKILDVIGNEIKLDIAHAGSLQIDRATLENLRLAFADSPAFEALDLHDRPALLMGMEHLRLFSRVTIDFRRGRVAFDLDG